MKKKFVFAAHCLLIVVLAVFNYKFAYTQSSIAEIVLVNEEQLTAKEKVFAQQTLKSNFAKKYWYVEFSFDHLATQLQISLPEEEPIVFELQRKKEQASGLLSWCGRSSNGATAVFAWHNGMIHGNIAINPKHVFGIVPLGGSRHLVYIINQSNSPKEESNESYERMKNGGDEVPDEMNHPRFEKPVESDLRSGGNDCYIRVLVGFDHDAGLNEADPIGFALECAELSNTIYANSQINFQMEIAFVKDYPDVASSDIDDALTEWQFDFGDGKFNDVFSDREQYDADFCILIAEDFTGDYVGLAATILASYGSAFCVVERGSAIDNLSFTHEIGHLMGARHDLYMDGSGDFNHGYIIHSEKVRTVMAYNDACDANGYYCDRIQYFSTPDVDYPGTSKALGTATNEHNERALDENESAFADFEPVVTNKSFLFPETVSGSIYGSVSASSTITNASIYEVVDGANVVWSAGDAITLDEDFFVESGSQFQAKVAGCDALRVQDETLNAFVDDSTLYKIYPNPAVSEITVSFQIEKKSNVAFSLLDLLGRKIFETSPQLYESGMHQLPINLEVIPAGTYLCDLIVDGERKIKKIIVQQ
jgi:hypothetical protein